MTIKKFTKKAPIKFEYEDVEFNLPGEMPIATSMYLAELEMKRGQQYEMTREDLEMVYSSLLGEENAKKLINEMKIGNDTLGEILAWYGQELAVRQNKLPNQQSPKKATSR